MKPELFEALVASVREGGQMLRGKRAPARVFVVVGLDVEALRENYGLSQRQFAALLGVSVRTLRNWEQGRRAPREPSALLLRVAAEHPDAVWEVVRP
jgi:putative transcriptional regulator